MRIAGFQPLSLIDYPGVIAAIVFTQGCLFRCPYCHNPELIPKQSAAAGPSPEELVAALRKHRNMLEGVCITGGEPTIHPDLPDFIKLLKAEGFLIKLDTNGVSPEMVKQLIEDKMVDYFAMDLKQTWEKYSTITNLVGTRVTEKCRETFQLISDSGLPHEFRTTIASGLHTEDDIVDIAKNLKDGTRYALQPIRYEKTFKNLVPQPLFNLDQLTIRIRQLRPDLELVLRT